MPDDKIQRLIHGVETAAYNLGKAEARGMIRETESEPRADLYRRRQALLDAIDAAAGRAAPPSPV